MLLVLFLLPVTYFLSLTGNDNEYSTAKYTDTLNNVSINSVSSSSRSPRSEIGSTVVSNAGTSTVPLNEYEEGLPTKNDGANGLVFTNKEPVMDSETIVILNDYEIVIPDGTSIDISAGSVIEKAAIGTIIHVGSNGALLTRIDGTILTFPPNSVMEFHSIHSVTDFLDSGSNVDYSGPRF